MEARASCSKQKLAHQIVYHGSMTVRKPCGQSLVPPLSLSTWPEAISDRYLAAPHLCPQTVGLPWKNKASRFMRKSQHSIGMSYTCGHHQEPEKPECPYVSGFEVEIATHTPPRPFGSRHYPRSARPRVNAAQLSSMTQTQLISHIHSAILLLRLPRRRQD